MPIDGVVTSSWGLPLVPFKLYKVDDGTGEVTVVSQNGRTPTRGAHVRVTGRVSEVATFGGSSVGLHLEQTDLDFKRYEFRTDHRGHVVVRGRVAAPLGDGLKDRRDDLRGRQLARTPDHIEQPRRRELLPELVHRLEHAVRAEHEEIARRAARR